MIRVRLKSKKRRTNTVEKFHFSITGDYTTDIVREFVLSNEHIKAIDLLREFEGLDIESIYNILNGSKKLVGTNCFDLVDDNDQDYVECLKYKFSGVVKGENSVYYKPYAYVRTYGYADYRFSENSRGYLDRAEYYKRNQTDIIKMLDIAVSENITMRVAVIFEKIEVPDFIALIFKIGRDFKMACDEYLKNGTLLVITAEESNVSCPIQQNNIQITKKKEKEEVEIPEKRLSSFRSGEEITRMYAWILPSGDSYECEYMEHAELAALICNEVFGIDPNNTIWEGKERPSADRYLEKIGAIKLGSSLLAGPYVHYEYESKKLFTQVQMNKVFDWCELYDVRFPKDIFEELE